LHRISPFRARPDVQIAVLGGGPDGPGKVELLLRSVTHPTAKPFQCDLDVARTKLDAIVEIAELAPVPNLDGPAVTTFLLADAHALGIVAIGTERRSAGSADPFRATLMARFLFLQPLAQRLHQLFETAEGFDQSLLFLREVLLGKPAQPFVRQVGGVRARLSGQRLQPPEDMR